MDETPVGHRPTRTEVELARLLLAPWWWLTSPRFSGLEHVPVDRPVLLAGNHSTLAVLDAPILLLGLHDRLGLFPRTVGDHVHFRVPAWRALVERFGVVDGTPENVRALMRAGETIVVFPGGAREVFKRRGEKYALIWGRRTGFARLAIEFGYPIIPFAAVGAEDLYDIVFDADDVLRSPLGPIVRRLAPRADLVPPLVAGLGFTAVPKVQRLYFHFAEAVDTAPYAGRQDDQDVAFAVRERVRSAVEASIAHLREVRERDPERDLAGRLLAAGRRLETKGKGATGRGS